MSPSHSLFFYPKEANESHRYEREYNLGHRSAIKLVQEQDSSAASSMVLCVSRIDMRPAVASTSTAGPASGGLVPALELTDGWYRIQASVDSVLASAIQRKKLRVGCKIALSGARVRSLLASSSIDSWLTCLFSQMEGNEGGSDVLDSLDKSVLVLTGNTTSLARWDALLGFQRQPFVACLSSLSPDGGAIPMLDIIVTKVHPVAFVDNTLGDKAAPMGDPRSEADERIEREKWLVSFLSPAARPWC